MNISKEFVHLISKKDINKCMNYLQIYDTCMFESKVVMSENTYTYPIIVACEYGCVSIVESLIAKGVNINVCNSHGWNSLCKALYYNHDKITDLLLSQKNLSLDCCHLFACAYKSFRFDKIEKLLNLLLPNLVLPNSKVGDYYLLSLLIRDYKYELAYLAIEKGADPNYNSHGCLDIYIADPREVVVPNSGIDKSFRNYKGIYKSNISMNKKINFTLYTLHSIACEKWLCMF